MDIGDTGRHSDGGVLANSTFGQPLEAKELCIRNKKSGDKGQMMVSSWPLFNAMLFLNDIIRQRR